MKLRLLTLLVLIELLPPKPLAASPKEAIDMDEREDRDEGPRAAAGAVTLLVDTAGRAKPTGMLESMPAVEEEEDRLALLPAVAVLGLVLLLPLLLLDGLYARASSSVSCPS